MLYGDRDRLLQASDAESRHTFSLLVNVNDTILAITTTTKAEKDTDYRPG